MKSLIHYGIGIVAVAMAAFSSPAYYTPVDSISTLGDVNVNNQNYEYPALVKFVTVSNVGNYVYYSSCPGVSTLSGPDYISAVVGCWVRSPSLAWVSSVSDLKNLIPIQHPQAFIQSTGQECNWVDTSNLTADNLFIYQSNLASVGRWLCGLVANQTLSNQTPNLGSYIDMTGGALFGAGPQAVAVSRVVLESNSEINFAALKYGANYQTVTVPTANTTNAGINNSYFTNTFGDIGFAFYLNASGTTNTYILNSSFNMGSGGAIEYNIAPNSNGDSFRVSNNYVLGNLYGAFNINGPGSNFWGGVVSGNILKSTLATSSSPILNYGNAGFEGIAFVGNVLQTTAGQAIHLEDSHKDNVIVGNVSRGDATGIYLTPDVISPYTHQSPASIVGNALFETVANTQSGLAFPNVGYAPTSGFPIIGNVFRNFRYGMVLSPGGHAVVELAAGNTVFGSASGNCTAVQEATGFSNGSVIWAGTNFGHNCTYLFQVDGPQVVFGKVYSDTAPTNIFSPYTYSGELPAVTKGFSYPVTATATANGSVIFYQFPQAFGPSSGTIYYSTHASGQATVWLRYSTSFVWDGTTLTLSNEEYKQGAGSSCSAFHLVLSSGIWYLTATCTTTVGFSTAWLDVDGAPYISDKLN